MMTCCVCVYDLLALGIQLCDPVGKKWGPTDYNTVKQLKETTLEALELSNSEIYGCRV